MGTGTAFCFNVICQIESFSPGINHSVSFRDSDDLYCIHIKQ